MKYRTRKRVLRKLDWVAKKTDIMEINWIEKLTHLADLLLMHEMELEIEKDRRRARWKNVFSIKE